jgi:histidinol phosphatase-like enzyme (inositol monophosphatase family)
MRDLIQECYPTHGVIGEEFPATRADAEFVWVLDPVDGTKSFVTGTYGFGTLVGLCQNGAPILGVLNQPVLNERWLGVRGCQTLLNGRPISTRRCAAVSTAALFTHDPLCPDALPPAETSAGYQKLMGSARFKRFSQDCIAYGVLAAGCADIVVEALQWPWDYIPLIPIVSGAGGALVGWDGSELMLDRSGPSKTSVVAVGDKDMLPEVVSMLGGDADESVGEAVSMLRALGFVTPRSARDHVPADG